MHRAAKKVSAQEPSTMVPYLRSMMKMSLILGVLAYLTNPHDDGFLAAYQRKRFGLVGAAVDHIGQKLGVVDKHETYDYFLGTAIHYRNNWHLGVFGTYIELPQMSTGHVMIAKQYFQIPVFEHIELTPDFLAIVMVAVFVLFQLMPAFMWSHFVLSWEGLTSGRIWTVFTATIAHIQISHLILNVTSMLAVVGEFSTPQSFFEVFFVTGVLSGLISTLLRRFVFNSPRSESVGASGAIFGLLGKLLASNPKWELVFLGRVFTPGQYLWARLAVDCLLGFFGGGIDVLAHVAGAAVGFNYDALRSVALQVLYQGKIVV